MNRPFTKDRGVIAVTPRGIKVDGFLISHDKIKALIQRADGKLDFYCAIENVQAR